MINKINPKKIMPDPCQKSLDWLEEFATNWFRDNVPNHGQLWFSDENQRGLTSNFPNPQLPVEVILTGNFFIRILESNFWNFEKFRLWTFSPQIKLFLTDIIKIDPNKIGIIGRPSYLNPTFTPNFNQEVNLIYAGRLSLTKNIPALLKVVSLLQTQYEKKVTLDIFGSFDSFPDESLGKYHLSSSLEEITHNTFKELPWSNPPVFHGDVPQGQWLEIKRTFPAFFSLSTSMYEDFGTASQMAASKGWPSILSSWGGHKSAQNFISIPSYLIPQIIEPVALQDAKAQIVAKRLVNNEFEFIRNESDHTFIPSIFYEKQSYQERVRHFVDKNLPEILFCFREKMVEFADTSKGINFFKNYQKYFSQNLNIKTAIIYDELNPIKDLTLSPTPFELITTRELFSNYYLQELEHFEEIIFLNLDANAIKKVSHFLESTLSLKASIHLLKPRK